jgi:tetrahydromethanopterin S-methyltransferase subunit G
VYALQKTTPALSTDDVSEIVAVVDMLPVTNAIEETLGTIIVGDIVGADVGLLVGIHVGELVSVLTL